MDHHVSGEITAYRLVDEALQSYPVAEPPADLVSCVMTRIRPTIDQAGFRLAWFDYAISFFAAGMVGLVMVLWQLLPADMDLPNLLDLTPLLNFPSFWLTLFGGLVSILIALLMALAIFAWTRSPLTSG